MLGRVQATWMEPQHQPLGGPGGPLPGRAYQRATEPLAVRSAGHRACLTAAEGNNSWGVWTQNGGLAPTLQQLTDAANSCSGPTRSGSC
jgi:hypothetical protein